MSPSRAISWSRLFLSDDSELFTRRAGKACRLRRHPVTGAHGQGQTSPGKTVKASLGVVPALWSSSHTSNPMVHAESFRVYKASFSSHSHVRHREPSVIAKGRIIGGNWSPMREARYTEGLSWGYHQSLAPRATTHLSTINSEPWNHVVLPCFRGTKSACKPAMETEMLKYPTCDNFISV